MCGCNVVCLICLKKGYKLTKQGKTIFRMGWKQVTSNMQGGKMLSTMTMEANSEASAETETSATLSENCLFKREVCPFFDPSASIYGAYGDSLFNYFSKLILL